jgi:hypothetical protein
MDPKEMLCIPIQTDYVDYVARIFHTRKGKDPQFYVTVMDSKDDLKYCERYDTLMDAKQMLVDIEFKLRV